MSEGAPVQQHPSYENYSATAASYDLTRVPVGMTEAELRAALSTLRSLHDAGTVAAFVEEQDRVRRWIGQAVFLQARRR